MERLRRISIIFSGLLLTNGLAASDPPKPCVLGDPNFVLQTVLHRATGMDLPLLHEARIAPNGRAYVLEANFKLTGYHAFSEDKHAFWIDSFNKPDFSILKSKENAMQYLSQNGVTVELPKKFVLTKTPLHATTPESAILQATPEERIQAFLPRMKAWYEQQGYVFGPDGLRIEPESDLGGFAIEKTFRVKGVAKLSGNDIVIDDAVRVHRSQTPHTAPEKNLALEMMLRESATLENLSQVKIVRSDGTPFLAAAKQKFIDPEMLISVREFTTRNEGARTINAAKLGEYLRRATGKDSAEKGHALFMIKKYGFSGPDELDKELKMLAVTVRVLHEPFSGAEKFFGLKGTHNQIGTWKIEGTMAMPFDFARGTNIKRAYSEEFGSWYWVAVDP